MKLLQKIVGNALANPLTRERALTGLKVLGTVGLVVAGAEVLAADDASIAWTTATDEVGKAAAAVKTMIQAGTGAIGMAFAWGVFKRAA